MSKIVFGSLFIFLLFFFGIAGFVSLTRSEKVSTAKLIFYSAFCSLLTIAVITAIVILF